MATSVKLTRRSVSQKRNWTLTTRLEDDSLLMYGKRGACFFYLCTNGCGRGFAYEADFIKAINSHSHKEH